MGKAVNSRIMNRVALAVYRVALAVLCLVAISCSASAQSGMNPSSSPVVGGTIPGPDSPLPTFGASGGNDILRHRGPTGSPCLTVSGFARPYSTNKNLYDHVVTAVNSCAERISMRVCYYNTQDCIAMEIPGDERKEAVLGTMPAEKDFRFEFRENFGFQ
jgi:hypothetical protein